MSQFTIPTNPENDVLAGRNGRAKLQSILVTRTDTRVFIDGINSRNRRIANSGFAFDSSPNVLRALADIFASLANAAEQKKHALTKQSAPSKRGRES